MNKRIGELQGMFPCVRCPSSDAMAVYKKEDDDGGEYYDGYCFSCETYIKDPLGNGDIEIEKKDENRMIEFNDIKNLPIKQLTDRGISGDVAKVYGVRVAYDGQTGEISHHYYPYHINGKLTGYKERDVNRKENFRAIGHTRSCQLFGQHLFSPGGKMLLITEGECDAMAAYQMFKALGKTYKVVSLSGGANVRSIKNNLEYVESFEKVILCLDQDKQGKDAAIKIAQILSPGKASIVHMDEKDANDMLKANKVREFYLAVSNSREYRPDGIVRLSDTWNDLWKNDNIKSIPYPWDGVNEKLYGIRPGELVTLTSGSGMGKSSVTRELEHHLFKHTDDNIGILALEENIGKTSWGIVSIEASLPLFIREHRQDIPKEQIKKWFDQTVGTGRFVAYDHFGSTSEDNLISQVRYLIKGMDCKWIFLDHLSIVVSSMEEGGDERRTIDSIMTKLRTLVEETGAGLFLVSHLRRMSGDKGHEQGGEVSLSQLRGSHSIGQLSDGVISLERNGQDKNEKLANLTRVRVLKNRYAGLTGVATHLYYDRQTGRLQEIDDVEEFVAEDEEMGF